MDLIPPPNCPYFEELVSTTHNRDGTTTPNRGWRFVLWLITDPNDREVFCRHTVPQMLWEMDRGIISAVAEKFWRLEHKMIRVTIRLTAMQVCTKQIDLWAKWGEGK